MSENEREKEKDGEEKSGREAYEWVQAWCVRCWRWW